jgi:hypothetical protein
VRIYAGSVKSEKWQRNSISTALVDGGLDPIECTFDDHEVPWRLAHMPSGAHFLVGGTYGHFKLTLVVGDEQPSVAESYDWANVLTRVKRWAGDVKRDVDTPDLWDEVRRRQGVLTGASYENADNSRLTETELTEIVERVEKIKELVRTQTTSARMLSVEAKLDYVVEAARRLGRKDWALMFGGAIVSVLVADLLPREVVGDILSMAANVLSHLFNDLSGPSQFPPMTPLAPPPMV